MQAELSNNQSIRLEALYQYQILDTEPEEAFDDLTRLAAYICGTPVALVSLIDAKRQWFKSKLAWNTTETPRDIAFCNQAILQPNVFIVNDALTDERFATNPLVTSEPYIRFYAGVPLITPEGHALGMLCVIDYVPRELELQQVVALKALGRQVIAQLELRRNLASLTRITTECKRTEQKVREQAALLDVTTDAIIVRNLNNQILFWNKGAEHLYGWNALDICGKDLNELLSQEVSPLFKEAEKIVFSKSEWHGELHKVTKSGKEVIVSSRWTLMRDEEGKPKSILTIDTNITEKKQLEAQFLQAQRLESIGTLASGIAHDLNNILGPILMIAELLQENISKQCSQQLISELEVNAKRGANLVKQVLGFARGMGDKRTILQVRHLLNEVKQIAKQTFPKSIEIYTDISTKLWTVSADATQLHQVLMNLCVNARDAMPNGGTLSICAENLFIDETYARMNLDARVGPYIVITVSDTGIGIPPKILDRIFEPFFTTKGLDLGTGLGLSTVRSIIKSHGGFINVVQVERTQFQVYLPAVEGIETQQAKDLKLPTGHGELILVVDDELVIRNVTKTSLETYNYKVLSASDGIEAIALYTQHKDEISAVVMDMMMPFMDGATAIRIMKKINSQAKIIAVSGLASSDQVIAAIKTEIKAYLSKPYTVQELLNTINAVKSVN